MSDTTVIHISPPLTMDEIKDGPELSTIELIHLREPGEPFPSAEPWTANAIDYADGATRYPEPVHAELQSVMDYYAGHEFTGYLEVRNISPGLPPVSRYVMRDRLVVRLNPFIGWPLMQADDPSEDGLMDILGDPDAVVSVSSLVAGYATDVWETVPADDTDLPEKLLAWRDAAIQKALAESAGTVERVPVRMAPHEVGAVLADMTARVQAGDSFDGSISYHTDYEHDGEGHVFDVTAVYRVGNRMGQGGIRIIEGLRN